MKIALTTIGSTGDLQPFLALAVALQWAGHQVRVCSHDVFAPRFEAAGIEYIPVGAPMDEARRLRVWEKIDAAGGNILRQIEVIIDELFLCDAARHVADCTSAMAGFDLAVCHHGDMLGQEAALRHGLRWVGVVLCPGIIRTRLNPPLNAPDLGRFGNPLMWALGGLAARRLQRRASAVLGALGTTRRGWRLDRNFSPDLNLLAASPALAAPPADLPSTFVTTGFWFHQEPAYHLPADLAAFLESGPPPVIVSFGSMGGAGGDKTAALLIEAGRLAGQRLIIQKGFGGICVERELAGRDVYFADFIPHEHLFPHGACVVHHGGAGTTAAVCRAGRPSVVVPHLIDQLYWAARLRQAGIAPKAIARQRLTAARLAERITRTLASASMAPRAAALGETLRAEDGLGRAVAAITAFGASG